MAKILQLTGTGPGRASIELKGIQTLVGDIEMAIQRSSDDAYIGNDGAWQSSPTWHRLQPSVDTETGQFVAGPEIVDTLAEVARSDSFQAQLRWADGAAKAGLSIRGELFPSAAQQSPPESPSPDPGPVIGTKKTPGPIPPAPQRPKVSTDTEKNPAKRFTWPWLNNLVRRPSWPWLLGSVALIAALGIAAWQLWPQSADQALDNVVADAADTGETVPPEAPAEEPEYPPQEPLAQESEPDFWHDPELQPEVEPDFSDYAGLSGNEYASKVVDENPSAKVYLAHARSRGRLDDCTALELLYEYAARKNAKIAAEVARLYDPKGFVPSHCFPESSLELANKWYEKGAEAGVPHAQRRYGEILIEGQISSPDRQEGKKQLTKAAENGDEQAERILEVIKAADKGDKKAERILEDLVSSFADTKAAEPTAPSTPYRTIENP